MRNNHSKRFIGIILIVLQLMAFYGSIDNLPTTILGWIGFCIFGIVGISLIIEDFKENKSSKGD